jgi:hypothetical protein
MALALLYLRRSRYTEKHFLQEGTTMPTMVEQAPIDQVSESPFLSATYGPRNVDVPVVVSVGTDGKLVVDAPTSFMVGGALTFPNESTWTVTWTLSGDSLAVFDNPGIGFPGPLPDGVEIQLCDPPAPKQWKATVVNTVAQWQSQSQSFTYNIFVCHPTLGKCRHDPTIVVTPDPIT